MTSCPADINEESNVMITITIPPLPCSFPWKNYTEALEIKEMSDQWVVDRFKEMPSACKGTRAASFFTPEHLIDSAFYLPVTLFYANAASTHLLFPIVKLMNWYFMLDNIVDDPSEMGSEPAQASYLIDCVAAVFELNKSAGEEMRRSLRSTNPSSEYVDKLETLIAGCAAEWWDEMRKDMPPAQQARFSKAFIEYLRSNKVQVPYRMNRHLPDLKTYLGIRRVSISWFPLSILTEYSLSVDLDQEVLSHPLMQALKDAAGDHIALVNDVTSFRKEYLQKDMFNVVFVLCYNKKLNSGEKMDDCWAENLREEELQEAMVEACTIMKEKDGECVQVMEEIKGCSLLMQKAGIARCLEGIAYTLSGNVYWHLTSGRYGLLDKRMSAQKHTHFPDLLASHHIHLPYFK